MTPSCGMLPGDREGVCVPVCVCFCVCVCCVSPLNACNKVS